MPRPRSEEARRKAIAAATDLIIERGVDGLTIEEVAIRSGVAKTTIYRHWSERPALVLDTVRAAIQHVGTPDTGSLRGDLMAFFGGMVRADLSGKAGQLMPCIIEAAHRDPEMGQLVQRLGEERQAPILEIIGRAQDRGELPPDLDHEVVIGSIVGPIVFRKVMQRLPVTEAYLSSCLDVAISGLVASTPTSSASRF